MPNKELVEYIRSQLSAGDTKEGVTKVLADAGWPRAEIDKAFAEVERPTPPPLRFIPTEEISSGQKPGTKLISTSTVLFIIVVILCGAAAAYAVFFMYKNPTQDQTQVSTPVSVATSTPARIKYLLFQAGATAAPAFSGSTAQLTPKAQNEKTIDDIVGMIGEKGDGVHQQLGIMFGPYSFDMTDAQIKQSIDDAFAIAEEKNVAIGFHIDDSMFWNNRKDLWSNKNNVEWSDWSGKTVPHRIIGWVANGSKTMLAPPMCFNSPAIVSEVQRQINAVYAPEIQKGIDHLKSINKEYLFAGVIAGWETHLQDEGGTYYGYYGYCSLHNLGYSATNTPPDMATALAGVVNDWIVLWTKGFADAGIARDKIFTHIAYGGANTYAANTGKIDLNKENPVTTASNQYSYPGFSVYGTGVYSDLHKLLDSQGNVPWGISEGTAVGLANSFTENGASGPSPMEGYLAGAFNHGAIYVDIFGWGDKKEGGAVSQFSEATESSSSIAAYQKFLRGQALADPPASAMTGSAQSSKLPDKMSKISGKLQSWMQAHPDQQSHITSLMTQLTGYAQQNDAANAEKIADQVLALMGLQ